MSVINGNAKKFDGTAIDYVSIFKWVNGKEVATVTPNENGSWSLTYFGTLNIGITYIADGCEPITHGPYSFIGQSAFKHWRLSKVTTNYSDIHGTSAVLVAEIKFYDASGASLASGGVATASSGHSDNRGNPANAFDGLNSTMWAHAFNDPAVSNLNTWIAYEFLEAKEVSSVGLVMRQDMRVEYLQEWQTAVVEVSNNGIDWEVYGRIEPKIKAMNLSLVKSPIITNT